MSDRNRERRALRDVGTAAGMNGKQERTLQGSCLVTIAVTGRPANAARLPSAQVIKYELKNQFLGAAGDIKNSQKFNSANVRPRRSKTTPGFTEYHAGNGAPFSEECMEVA